MTTPRTYDVAVCVACGRTVRVRRQSDGRALVSHAQTGAVDADLCRGSSAAVDAAQITRGVPERPFAPRPSQWVRRGY